MKNITKKQSKEFNTKIEKLLISNDFIVSQEDSYENNEFVIRVFYKNTNFGKITISLHSQVLGDFFSVFSRFNDIKKAQKMFECNPHTGKYNYHFTKEEGLNGFAWGQIKYFMDELNAEIWVEEVEND